MTEYLPEKSSWIVKNNTILENLVKNLKKLTVLIKLQEYKMCNFGTCYEYENEYK